jgi:CheY-like chemotaxis protein
MTTYDFLSPTDRPALLGTTFLETQQQGESILQDLGYKVHAVQNHDEFLARFSQVSYPVVIIDELFDAQHISENRSLQSLQLMPMPQRRHAAVLLISDTCNTLDSLRAFQLSVHAVVHRSDLHSFGQVILKTVSDNDLFLQTFREAQIRALHRA